MRNAIYCFLVLLLGSCAEQPKKEVPLVQSIASPASEASSLPYLFSNANKILMSWVEKVGDSAIQLRYSELLEGQWQPASNIIEGTDWFVNWADFPVIAENRGNLISHVLKKSSIGTYSYDVKLNVLPKGEGDWGRDLPLHTDGTATEHGFVTSLPYKAGFFVTWLDGRNTVEDENGDRGAMTIRAAELTPHGEIATESLLDARACDCCQTTAAITTKGPVVIYRDRSEGEVRDISIVRSVDGKWTAPKAVYDDGWFIKGCPVNGPKAAVSDNNLVVAWFTAADEKPRVKLAFSDDGGEHFDAPIRIDQANAMGRVDVLLLDAETAVVSWMESIDKQARIKAVKVSRNGEKSVYHHIADLDASRATGFPQMESLGDKVYFAWTDVVNEVSSVRTAYVLVDRF